ncbi:hypothetical protein BV378_23660 [Nostoc sp. RF31YmG]|jgi:hypothetical protein|nr:hypothetical protein BV378_23660 [Nostoc sp. RF31YmG]
MSGLFRGFPVFNSSIVKKVVLYVVHERYSRKLSTDDTRRLHLRNLRATLKSAALDLQLRKQLAQLLGKFKITINY